jgi:hypothetical protein
MFMVAFAASLAEKACAKKEPCILIVQVLFVRRPGVHDDEQSVTVETFGRLERDDRYSRADSSTFIPFRQS